MCVGGLPEYVTPPDDVMKLRVRQIGPYVLEEGIERPKYQYQAKMQRYSDLGRVPAADPYPCRTRHSNPFRRQESTPPEGLLQARDVLSAHQSQQAVARLA